MLSRGLPAAPATFPLTHFATHLDLLDHEESEGKVIIWTANAASIVDFKPSKGRVLGENFPCGMVFEQQGANVQATMLFHSVVNGWLPSSIVSKAMPSTMTTLAKRLRQAVRDGK